MNSILLIINPVSGKKQGQACMFEVLERFSELDVVPTVRLTKSRGHATQIAREAAQTGKYDAVFCCGGDGTLNEVIAGLVSAGASIPVGYIPAGSTNDFASGLGIPLELPESAAAACRTLLGGTGFPLDIGLFDEKRYFTYIASFGAFSASSYNAPQSLKNVLGHLAYVLEGVKDFFRIKPIHAVCTDAAGVRREDDYVFGGVTNTYSVGGIVKLTEDMVSMNDGLFEVLLVRTPHNPAELNAIVRAAMSSEFENNPMIDFFRTGELTFEMPDGTQWSLDGEQADGGGTIRVRTLPRAATLLK